MIAYSLYAVVIITAKFRDLSLFKPIDSDDLEETIAKVKKYCSNSLYSNKIEKVLLHFNEKLNTKKIAINTDGKLIFLESKEILFIVSDGNYSTFHTTNNKKIVVTKKLKEINTLLPNEIFYRIHKSYIINLTKVKEFLKTDGYVIIENNHKIPVSRQKKSEFLEKF